MLERFCSTRINLLFISLMMFRPRLSFPVNQEHQHAEKSGNDIHQNFFSVKEFPTTW